MKRKSLNIAFEGGEGSGKGTLLNGLEKYLKSTNCDYLRLREPGGKKISEDIRNLILDKDNVNMSKEAEACLYTAARIQLLEDYKEEMNKKDLVLFDRSVYSSFAYQGFGRGVSMYWLLQINPINYIDYVVYLKLDSEKGINRIMTNRQDEINRLDLESIDFHKRVADGYDKLSRIYKEKFIVIDANQSKEKVLKDTIEELKKKNIL